jgi:hypothetical protein
MSELKKNHTDGSEEDLRMGADSEGQHPSRVLTRPDIIRSYRVAEFVTLGRDGSPVCWPLTPDFENDRLIFSTGYMYPTKARNAQRNPRVAALYSDPTASGRSDDDPLVLVQGLAEVFDQDLQRNTERYVDQLLRTGPPAFRLMLHIPPLRQAIVGYLARIWIEVIPKREYVWARANTPPEPLSCAIRPASFSPTEGIDLSQDVSEWLPRYTRPPVLTYIDTAGWPAMIRVRARLRRDRIAITSDIETSEGAPACLTYHRLIGNYRANDAFLIRGHFGAAGELIPEKLVGYGGTKDDRGVGSVKMLRFLVGLRGQLRTKLAKEGSPIPIARKSPRA